VLCCNSLLHCVDRALSDCVQLRLCSHLLLFIVYIYILYILYIYIYDRLCGLVVRVFDYRHRGPGFDSRALQQQQQKVVGLERGALSLVSTN
jgi:hypothetical protein